MHPIPGGGMGSWTMLRVDAPARTSSTATRLTRGTGRRIVAFARPYRRDIAVFLVTVVISRRHRRGHAGAGRRRGQHDHRRRRRGRRRRHPHRAVHRRPGRRRRVAVAGPAVVLGAHRRGHHPRPAHPGLRPRAADAVAVLHPHADRRAGQPAQQRRAGRPAGVHLDAVRRGQQRHPARAHRGRDVHALLADHRCCRWCMLPVFILPARRVGRAAGRDHPRVLQPRRQDERHDDRAVRRVRRAAGQAVRPARDRGGAVRRPGRAGPRHRHPVGDVLPHLLRRDAAGRLAGAGADVRPGRLVRRQRQRSAPAPSWRWRCC